MVFFWTRHRRWQHTTSHINTYQHAHQAHSSFQDRYRPTSFQVARGLHRNTWTIVSCMMWTCQTNKEWAMHGPRTLALRQDSTERANWTSDHWSLLLKEVLREKRKNEMRGERETRAERHKKRGGARERLLSKRSRVERSNHPCPMWHGRLERAHGSVLTYTRKRFSVQDKRKRTNTTPHHTTPHHTTPHCTTQHNTTPHHTTPHTTQRHVKREPDEKRERDMKRERRTCEERERESIFSFFHFVSFFLFFTKKIDSLFYFSFFSFFLIFIFWFFNHFFITFFIIFVEKKFFDIFSFSFFHFFIWIFWFFHFLILFLNFSIFHNFLLFYFFQNYHFFVLFFVFFLNTFHFFWTKNSFFFKI